MRSVHTPRQPTTRRSMLHARRSPLLLPWSRHDAGDLHANPIHIVTCGDVQALAVGVAERDVGRTDLPLRLTTVYGQIQHAEQLARWRGDADDAGTRAARRIDVAGDVDLHTVADTRPFREQTAAAER